MAAKTKPREWESVILNSYIIQTISFRQVMKIGFRDLLTQLL